MNNEERCREFLKRYADFTESTVTVRAEDVKGFAGRLRKAGYALSFWSGLFVKAVDATGAVILKDSGDWVDITRREPVTKGRPPTRTGPAKRETFADTGVKLGDDRKRWLKENYASQQQGICQLIDEKMAVEAGGREK